MRKSLRKIKSPTKLKAYRRKLSIRKSINGTAEIPRICVTKTNKHLFVQAVDDVIGKTLASVSTFGKNNVGSSANLSSAELVGKALGEKLNSLNVKKAVFDRNGRVYTGVIAKVADTVENLGFKFN